jgi:Tol biopolymer transport system component
LLFFFFVLFFDFLLFNLVIILSTKKRPVVIYTAPTFGRPLGFSGDSSVLVFQADSTSRLGCLDIWAVGVTNLTYVLRLNTYSGAVLPVYNFTTAVLSPDGRRVVFSASPALSCSSSLLSLPADTPFNAYSLVVTDKFQELLQQPLATFPDNGSGGVGVANTATYDFAKERVLFTVDTTTGTQLLSTRKDGTDSKRLNSNPISGYILSASTGRVGWAEATSLNIYSQDVGGDQFPELLGQGNGRAWSVSADGSTLLYLDFSGVGPYPYSVVPFRGGRSRTISGEFQFGSLADDTTNPLSAISPNGKWVVYAALTLVCTNADHYGLNVYAVPSLGNSPPTLLSSFFDCRNKSLGANGGIRFTPDGKRVVFAVDLDHLSEAHESFQLYSAPLEHNYPNPHHISTLLNPECPRERCVGSPDKGTNFFISENSRYVFYGSHPSFQNLYYAPVRGGWSPNRLNEHLAANTGADVFGTNSFFDAPGTHLVYNYQPRDGVPDVLNFYVRDVIPSECASVTPPGK